MIPPEANLDGDNSIHFESFRGEAASIARGSHEPFTMSY